MAQLRSLFPVPATCISLIALGVFTIHPAAAEEQPAPSPAPTELPQPAESDLATPAPIPLESPTSSAEQTPSPEPEPPGAPSGDAESAASPSPGASPSPEAQTVVVEEVDLIVEDAPAHSAAETPATEESTQEPKADTAQTEGTETTTAPEDLDLIPLPDDIVGDAQALEIAPVEDVIPDSDIPPMEIPTALPSIPVGEPERVLTARFKELQTKVRKDAALVSLWEKADKARTYEDRRAALREYYRLLAKKMREADKTLTSRINAMERAYLQRLEQNRIEPTIPLNPPPTPEPLGTPAATPAASPARS